MTRPGRRALQPHVTFTTRLVAFDCSLLVVLSVPPVCSYVTVLWGVELMLIRVAG